MTVLAADDAPDRHLRVPEAARILGCTTRALYRSIDAGALTARRDARGLVVVPAAEVERLRPP